MPDNALRALSIAVAVTALSGCLQLAVAEPIKVQPVKPSVADPAVEAFDEVSLALSPPSAGSTMPLVVFLPGTGGKPENRRDFLEFLARQHYRVLGLAYDDEPSLSKVCPQNPDPGCSEAFRRMRVEGVGPSVVGNPVAEAIVTRLVKALQLLERTNPTEGWNAYLDGDQPKWSAIVVSGLSQGAGMAAYIAKHHGVRRVVLFSSPWDITGPGHTPAPWLSGPSATPADRWYAEYHRLEATAPLIQHAYAALAIPPDHILVFDKGLPPSMSGTTSPNPFHGSTIVNPAYQPQWREMFGDGAAVGGP